MPSRSEPRPPASVSGGALPKHPLSRQTSAPSGIRLPCLGVVMHTSQCGGHRSRPSCRWIRGVQHGRSPRRRPAWHSVHPGLDEHLAGDGLPGQGEPSGGEEQRRVCDRANGVGCGDGPSPSTARRGTYTARSSSSARPKAMADARAIRPSATRNRHQHPPAIHQHTEVRQPDVASPAIPRASPARGAAVTSRPNPADTQAEVACQPSWLGRRADQQCGDRHR